MRKGQFECYFFRKFTVTSYVIGLPTSSEKRFYGEDRKPYSVNMASMDTMGMSMFSP